MVLKEFLDKMNLSDEETIWTIQENPYMQYMLGLSEFTNKPVFDSSLFVTIRKRLQIDDLNSFTSSLLAVQMKKYSEKFKDYGINNDSDISAVSEQSIHKESLKIDATCSDAEVRYPTDVDLLNDASRVINRYIDKLCNKFSLTHPITFSKQSCKAYLEVIKHKKKTKKMMHLCKLLIIYYLKRDTRGFIGLIAVHGTGLLDVFKNNEKRNIRAIITMYHQQEQMFKEGVHTCLDRIISIFQPHIRPIVRAKPKSPTEFGAKIGVSVVDGYTFIDHHSWDAYNELTDLEIQIELYRKRFGGLPDKIYADKIYMNRANRLLMKELSIEAMGKPLGWPPKNVSDEYKSKMAKAVGLRNEVEATFGTGKRIYKANNIRTKLPQTANCWTGMCYFVKNVMRFLRELLHALFFIAKLGENTAILFNVSENKAGLVNYRILSR